MLNIVARARAFLRAGLILFTLPLCLHASYAEEPTSDSESVEAEDRGALEFAARLLAESELDVWPDDIPLLSGAIDVSSSQYGGEFNGSFSVEPDSGDAGVRYIDALREAGWSVDIKSDSFFFGVRRISGEATKGEARLLYGILPDSVDLTVDTSSTMDECASPADPASEEAATLILNAMVAAYQRLSSYRDRIEIRQYYLLHDGTVERGTYSPNKLNTAYSRPDRFRMQVTQTTSRGTIHYIYYQSANVLCFGNLQDSKVFYYPDIQSLMDLAGYHRDRVPKLLRGIDQYPDMEILQPRLIAEETVGSIKRHRIEGFTKNGMPQRLWIGMEDHLIRRFESFIFSSDQIAFFVFDYEAEANLVLDASELDYDPSGKIPNPPVRSWFRWAWDGLSDNIPLLNRIW